MSGGSRPLVSVATPAFNAARFLRETIESVRAQTFEDWEMLVADDCSQDATCAVVEELASRDRRVHLLRQAPNSGPAAARNLALDAARGRYIGFLDSDDLWLPGKLERQLRFMEERRAAFSFTEFRRINENGDACGRVVPVPRRLTYRELLKNTAIVTSTVLLDRERTGPFRMTRTYYDDFVLWLDLLKRGITAEGLREDLTRYRVVLRSVSRDKLVSARWVWKTYRQIEGLGVLDSTWCFAHYAWRAYWKHRRF